MDVNIQLSDGDMLIMENYASSVSTTQSGRKVQLQDVKLPDGSTIRWSRWHSESDIDAAKIWTWEEVKRSSEGNRGRPPKKWPSSVSGVKITWH